jgi:hypothetical protein
MIHRPFVIAAVLSVALLAGCTPPEATTVTNAHPPVPALIPETIPKPPVSAETLIWQPGHWDWTGGGYVWQRGQYVPAAGHGYLWMQGYWDHTPAGWTWQPAHWTS